MVRRPTPRRPDLIIQVSGPPCSGKSTWIVVLDDNTVLAGPAGGRDRVTDEQWRRWHRALDRAISTHTGPGRLFYIQGNPTPRAPGITVQRITADRDECHARATRDGRPMVTHSWIDRWWERYGPRRANSREW